MQAGQLKPGDVLLVPDYADPTLTIRDVAREGTAVVLILYGNYKPLRCTPTTCFIRQRRELR